MDALAGNLVVYSVQIAIVVGLAALAAAVTPAGPATRLAYWRAVLAASLVVALPGAVGVAPVGPAVLETVRTASIASVARPAAGGWTWSQAVLLVWGAGAAARLAWLAVGLAALARLRRRAGAPVGRAGTAAVRWSSQMAQPVSFGLRRPVILLPERLRALPDGARAAVLRHEQHHVTRRDWAWHVAEEAVGAVLWFHPAVWWTLDRIRLHREQTVDAAVAGTSADRRLYMETLLALADGPETRVPAPGFAAPRHLRTRLRALAAPGGASRRPRTAGTVLTVALATALLAACALPWQSRVYSPDDPGITLPTKIADVRPFYPLPAQNAGVQGIVRLVAVVNTDGAVEHLRVIESLDTEYGLDDAARHAVSQWRFEPGTRNGDPVAVEVEFVIRFALS